MKNYTIYVLGAYLLLSPGVWAQNKSDAPLQADSLAYEFAILEKTLLTLHPGLYRYLDTLQIDALLTKYREVYTGSSDLREAFLNLSALSREIACGHTYPNYWNQSKAIQKELFLGEDKLPLTFVILGDRMYLQKNLSQEKIPEGSELIEIHGQAMPKILENLMQYSRSDGANDLKRQMDMSITGYGKFEAFDILFPLLYPPQDGKYSLKIKTPQGETQEFTVKTIGRKERAKRIAERYAPPPEKEEDLWSYRWLNDSTALLQLGTFAVWNFEMNWKQYLKNFFSELSEKEGSQLILDIRGNEGGLMEVYWELFAYLTDKPLALLRDRQWVRYQAVPQDLRPYLSSWEKGLFDIQDKVTKFDARFYRLRDTSEDTLKVKPAPQNFTGKLTVLMDAANSSATFYLAKYIRDNKLGTLVGQRSGGNQMGTNGGLFFMLRLPYTKLEVDIPLIGYYPGEPGPNRGLSPDYPVERNKAYYFQKGDKDVEKALELFSKMP